jgi:hypothetical protein
MTFTEKWESQPVALRRTGYVLLLTVVGFVLNSGVWNTTYMSEDITLAVWGSDNLMNRPWDPFLGKWQEDEQSGDTSTYYRPIGLLSHGLDSVIWGDFMPGRRGTNFVLHILCSLLVCSLVKRLSPSAQSSVAPLAGLLFIIHPVHEFPLWWLSARFDLLCGFFYLAALYAYTAYLEASRTRDVVAATCMTALALCSKEMAYTLPIACVFLGLLFAQNQDSLRSRITRAVKSASPIITVTTFFFLMRFALFSADQTYDAVATDSHRFVNFLHQTTRHLVFPFSVSLRQLLTEHTLAVALLLLLIATLLAFQWRAVKNRDLWIVAALLVISLIPIIGKTGPWTLYIPSMFFAMALAHCFSVGRSRSGIAAALLLCLLSLAYLGQWHDRKSAWRAADRAAIHVLDETQKFATDFPEAQPVFLSLPGTLGDVPLFMHFFTIRVKHALDNPDIEPVVLAYTILSEEPERQSIEFSKTESNTWTLTLSDPSNRLAFPDLMRSSSSGYIGEPIPRPWGTITFETENTINVETRASVRLNSTELYQPGVPWLIFADGELKRISHETGLIMD